MKTYYIHIPVSTVPLAAELIIPSNAKALIVFSHGSGSSRLSPRNRFIAEKLQEHGFATLLFDLLTEEEDADYEKRFDIALLTRRLVDVTRWVATQELTKGLNVCYFGASTGAASALHAAALLGDDVKAVVSRGGRPDLVPDALAKVTAPVLLIVGGYDSPVIEMNEKAFAQLRCKKEMKLVPGATHLFEEPGKLEEVAQLATEWYEKQLTPETIGKDAGKRK